jgi:serine protease Do
MMYVENSTGAQPFVSADLAALAERLRQSTVQVTGRRHGGGSGVIWNEDGLVITNSHVVAGEHAEVRLADGRRFAAQVKRRDRERDLAALQVAARNLPAIKVGDSSLLRAGELVFAVGNPLGHVGALSTGIIHATGRRWIQADLRLAPGNSGGPLANAVGEVVGINSMIAGGLALAVPCREVETFLRREGARERPSLGVMLRPLPVTLGDRSVLGLIIFGVQEQSAAMRAGLLIGDIVIGTRGRLFSAPDDLMSALEEVNGEGVLELKLIRGGKRRSLTVNLSLEQSAAEAM